MNDLLVNILFLLNRYIHIVATTLLVGGTLFYEMVVPLAIADMKTEHQLSVFARARWVFRWIVFGSVAMLLFSGVWSAYRNWNAYSGDEEALFASLVTTARSVKVEGLAPWQHPRTWVIAHGALGVAALAMAVGLVFGHRPPDRPVRWMRLNLMLLLIVIFVASATRNARMRLLETVAASAHRSLPFIPPAADQEPPTTNH